MLMPNEAMFSIDRHALQHAAGAAARDGGEGDAHARPRADRARIGPLARAGLRRCAPIGVGRTLPPLRPQRAAQTSPRRSPTAAARSPAADERRHTSFERARLSCQRRLDLRGYDAAPSVQRSLDPAPRAMPLDIEVPDLRRRPPRDRAGHRARSTGSRRRVPFAVTQDDRRRPRRARVQWGNLVGAIDAC